MIPHGWWLSRATVIFHFIRGGAKLFAIPRTKVICKFRAYLSQSIFPLRLVREASPNSGSTDFSWPPLSMRRADLCSWLYMHHTAIATCYNDWINAVWNCNIPFNNTPQPFPPIRFIQHIELYSPFYRPSVTKSVPFAKVSPQFLLLFCQTDSPCLPYRHVNAPSTMGNRGFFAPFYAT